MSKKPSTSGPSRKEPRMRCHTRNRRSRGSPSRDWARRRRAWWSPFSLRNNMSGGRATSREKAILGTCTTRWCPPTTWTSPTTTGPRERSQTALGRLVCSRIQWKRTGKRGRRMSCRPRARLNLTMMRVSRAKNSSHQKFPLSKQLILRMKSRLKDIGSPVVQANPNLALWIRRFVQLINLIVSSSHNCRHFRRTLRLLGRVWFHKNHKKTSAPKD